MKRYLLSVLIGIVSLFTSGQTDIRGKVLLPDQGKTIPANGAGVFWLGTNVGTITNDQGVFALKPVESTSRLVITFVGFKNDTVDVSELKSFELTLVPDDELEAIVLRYRIKSTTISYLETIKLENIGEKELQKAACCNLAESFETSPSVDISFTDAVTGTRQIQMLGLSGIYTQITRENMPAIRGINAIEGLTYIPGVWIESIQLNKGTGSVVNGFESSTGQINFELWKSEKAVPLYLNVYANQGSRLEFNGIYSKKLSRKLSTGMFVHLKSLTRQNDVNKDGFLDIPNSDHLIFMNRWKFVADNGLRTQLYLKYIDISTKGGQIRESAPGDPAWHLSQRSQRAEASWKIGYLNADKPDRSMALISSASWMDQKNQFGQRNYNPLELTFYSNFIYDRILSRTKGASIKTGLSFQYDNIREVVFDTMTFSREEYVPGAYFEYTYKKGNKAAIVLGARTDYSNYYGFFFTPRLHFRYEISENLVYRLSGGSGRRTPNVFSDNLGMFASSRSFIITAENDETPYGLDQEVAWNAGMSLTKNFKLNFREGLITLDLYHTEFQNQIIVDRDANPQMVFFYNLDGKSYANSVQVQIDYELLKRLDLRTAYRWYDVKATYHGELMNKPLISEHRSFVNLAYETRRFFKFDYTLNWFGAKRIPSTHRNPEQYRLDNYSPYFFTMNAQITKSWSEGFEIYLGIENILNYRQDSPLVSAENPYGPHFDGSMVWGPIFGRNTYLGFRYKLKGKKQDSDD